MLFKGINEEVFEVSIIHLPDDVIDDSVNSIADASFKTVVDDIELPGLLKKHDNIKWNTVLDLDRSHLIKWQKTCTDLKEIFELPYLKKQPKLVHIFCLNEGILFICTRFTIKKWKWNVLK